MIIASAATCTKVGTFKRACDVDDFLKNPNASSSMKTAQPPQLRRIDRLADFSFFSRVLHVGYRESVVFLFAPSDTTR